MAEEGSLEALQALHRDLVTTVDVLKQDRETQGPLLLSQLPQNPLLEALSGRFKRLLEKPGRKKESRDAVLSGRFTPSFTYNLASISAHRLANKSPAGKVNILDEEYTINKDFQEIALQIADTLDLDEIEATKLALLAEDQENTLGRSRKECAVILFHQERNYLLNCMLLLLQLSKDEDELVDENVGDGLGFLGAYVSENILRLSVPGATNAESQARFVPACMAAMRGHREWLQTVSEQFTSATVLGRTGEARFQETLELTYLSLTQQHELLSVILCYAIEKHVAVDQDFGHFLRELKEATRYEPCIGEFTSFSYFSQVVSLGYLVCKFHRSKTYRS